MKSTESPVQLVITSNASIEVDIGRSLLYICVAYSQDEPTTILWHYENALLTNSTTVDIYETQLSEFGLNFTQSIFVLCNVGVEDSGLYSCTANNSKGCDSFIFTLNIKVSFTYLYR